VKPRTPTPTVFGRFLRAARLGYRWWPRIRRFVRVRTPEEQGVEVDLTDGLNWPSSDGDHRCWWEGPEGDDGLLLSPYLAGLTPENAPSCATVRLDDDGRPR
jgi:hypothetical protein